MATADNVGHLARIAAQRHQATLKRANEPAVGDRVDDERRMASVLAAARRLPPPQQDVMMLSVFEGLRHGEIAAALGLRVGTVKSRLSRARASLHLDLGTEAALRESPIEPPDAEQGGMR